MQAQYYDKVYEVPDELGTDPAAIRAWIEKNAMSAPVQEPSFFQRVGGHLERGVANTAEAVANAFGTVGGKGVEKFYKERAAAIREAPLAKAVAEHPETSALGQIGAGLVEFIPELLAMQMTVGPVLGAAGSIPRVGKYVQALSPVKGEAFFPDTFRAITRGAVEGGLWGTTTAKSDSTIGERLAHGAEEAEAFAVGIGILHPTFFGLRKAVGMALGKAASRVRSDADVRAALESGKLSKENEARAKELLERQEQALQQQEADAIRGLGGSPADLERAARIEGEQAVGEMFGARQRTRPYEEQMPLPYDASRPGEPPPPAPAAGGFPEGAKAGGSGQVGEPTRLDQSLVQGEVPPTTPAAVAEPKRLSIKFVSEELGRRLSGLGATRAEVKAIVDQVTSKPMTDLAVRRELMLREFSSEDVAALKPEARREELNKLLVEERLDAEIEKRAPSTRVGDKGLSVTPELDKAIRFEQQVRKVAETEGVPLEKVAERTPEEIKDAYKRIMNGEVVEPAVKQAAPVIGKTDARGLELVDKVLDAAKDHPEYTPEELQLIRENLARFRDALIDQEQSRAATGEDVARKRRRLEPEQPVAKEKTPEELEYERELAEWMESDASPTEIAEKVAETGKPAPKAVETAEDWNKLLADEGMPEEPAGTILDFAGLQKMYEMIRDTLQKSTDKKELAKLGRGLMLEGSNDFEKFKSRVQEISGESWPQVRGHLKNMYEESKAWHEGLQKNGQLTYHGTKVFFERFSDEKIGSGEGAQVYGYGHYLTSKEDVAKWYAEEVGNTYNKLYDYMDTALDKIPVRSSDGKELITQTIKNFIGTGSSYKEAAVEGKNLAKSWLSNNIIAREEYENIVRFLDDIKTPENISRKVVHAVEIPRDLKLLDLDSEPKFSQLVDIFDTLAKRLSEQERGTYEWRQLTYAKQALDTMSKSPSANGTRVKDILEEFLGPKEASALLREAGFHGNTYIGRTSGERNYVIFDEKVPKVVGSYTLDFMGLQQGLEAFLGIARDFRKDGKSIVARELGEQLLGKNGKEWLVDRRPDFDKVRVWEPWLRIPIRLAEKIGGAAEKLVSDLIKADLRYQYMVKGPDGHYSIFDSVSSKLSKPERLELTKVLDGKARPTNANVAEAAATLKDWFKIMWDKRIKAQLADFESHLKPEENEALLNVINKGMDPGIAFAKFEPKDQKVLKSLLDDYKELQSRKIENYRPHVERGDILLQVQTEKGKFKTVAVALNSKDAVRKALALREVDPSIELFLDTNFAKDLPQGISKGQYWSVAARLSKANAELLKDINGEIGKGEAGAAARRAMRGIFVIKPTQKFSEYELRRMNILKGEEDVFDTLYSYAYKTEKKLALDPIIAQARKVINDEYAGQPNTQAFLRDLIDDVKGTYSWQDKAADDLMRWLGKEDASMSATKLAANIRMVEGYLKLGYRPVSALFNYLGGQSNVWAKFGTQYFKEGYDFLKTAEGQKFLKEMEPVMGQTFSHEGEALNVKGQRWMNEKNIPWWFQPMGLFERPEIPNRSIGLAAPYMYALKELKLPEAAAREFAMRQNWFSQATYNIANMPKLMRSPLGRTAGQFKTYMVNQIEFMATLRGPEAFRYIAAQIALGGPRGAVSFLKSVPFLAMMPWWDEMEDWMNKEYPNFSRGVIGGMMGMDVTGPSTLQFPTSVTDWLGPFVNDVIKVHRNVVSPYLEGAKPMPKTPGEAAEIPFSALEQVSPVIRYWPKLLIDRIAHPSQDSYIIKDQRGREIYRLEPFDLVKEVMGGTPTEAARVTQFQANERRRQKVENLRKGHVVDAVMEAMAEGNEIPDGYIEELIALGIKPASLRREAKLRSLPPEIRMMLQTQLSKRADLLERHPYQGD